MKITIVTNKKSVFNALENQILKNERIYENTLFDTLDDFIEHLYQLAMVLSNTNTSIDRDIFTEDVCISTSDFGKYSKTFNYLTK